MGQLKAFLVRDFFIESSYRLSFVMSLSTILFSTTTFFFISELIGKSADPFLSEFDTDYFSFVIIGVAFSGYYTLGLSAFARALRQAQTTGTLEAMVLTPASLPTIVVGSALWSYLLTTVRVFIYLLLGTLLFSLRLENANYLGALFSLVLSIVTFASIGIISAGIILVTKRGEPLTTLFAAFASLVGGIYYPVAIMPSWLQFIAKLVPVTYAVRSMRMALLAGATWSELAQDLAVLGIFTLILFPLSLVVFRKALIQARLEGSLTHY